MNLVYGKIAFGAAFGMLAVGSQAAAQEARRLDFGLRAGVEHHSNVTRTNETQAALRGLKMSDTIFTPTATIDFLQPVGQQSIFLRGSAGYAFYDHNTDLNRERLDFTGGVNGRAGPCGGTLTGGYARGINTIEDPTLVDDVKNIQEVTRVALDVHCTRETGLGAFGSLSKDWTKNDLAFVRTADSENSGVTAGLSYSRPTLGTLSLFGSYEETEYPKRLIDDGYDLTAFGATYERQLGARIQGSVTVAYNSVNLHAPGVGSDENVSTTAYSGSLSYRASSRLRFEGSFDRSVTPSAGLGRSYDLTTNYQLAAFYDLGSRIRIGLGGGRVERDSEGGAFLPTVQLTNSTTNTIFGSVTYKQSERLSFELNAGREERTTNAPQFDYTNNRIGALAAVRF